MTATHTIPIQLPTDQVLELALVRVRPDGHVRLLGEYFPGVMPLIFEYGGRPLLAFEVLAARGSDRPPQLVSLFSWPSVATFRRISADPRVVELLTIRGEALEWIDEANFFRAAQALSLELSPERHYALIAAWDDAAPAVPGRLLAEWAHDPDSDGTYRPRRLVLLELDAPELPAAPPGRTELFLLRPRAG